MYRDRIWDFTNINIRWHIRSVKIPDVEVTSANCSKLLRLFKLYRGNFCFQLFSRITKLGWYDVAKDEYVFRNVVTDVGKFIQSGSTQHVMIGVQLLSQLVCEMNRVSEVSVLSNLQKNTS